MLNILLPIAGDKKYKNSSIELPFIFREIKGKPMIQWVIENLETIKTPKKFFFIINSEDDKKFGTSYALKNLTSGNCETIIQNNQCKGAVCSCLLVADFLNNDDPLLICNADQVINHNLNNIMDFFNDKYVDAGVLTFKSVHPHWSFVKLNNDNLVIQAAEKVVISDHAIAGMYYFSKGQEYITAATTCIYKERHYQGQYYTSLVLNEYILENKKIVQYKIKVDEFLSLYSDERVSDFEKYIERNI